MYIYRATLSDGKSYIGSTNNFRKRKNSHLSKARNIDNNKVFYQAIRKFGEKKIKWEILMENVPEERVEVYEGAFVVFYNSYRDGYNSTELGQGNSAKRVFNLTNGKVYSSIREAARSENEAQRTVQKSIEQKYVTAKHNCFLLEEELNNIDIVSLIKREETIKYKKENNLSGLWKNHKTDIEKRVDARIKSL